MANDPYCGNCHDWMKPRLVVHGEVERWYCECPLGQADTSKDPNCHNSNHDHHDPQSPIVLSRKAEYVAEEKAERAEEDEVRKTRGEIEALITDEPEKGFVARDGPTDRPGSQFEGHTYEVSVFDSATGALLGWRLLDEPEIDEETREVLDGILRETTEQIEEE